MITDIGLRLKRKKTLYSTCMEHSMPQCLIVFAVLEAKIVRRLVKWKFFILFLHFKCHWRIEGGQGGLGPLLNKVG